MPAELKELQRRCQELQDQEEAAAERADYPQASELRAERIQCEYEFGSGRDAWLGEKKLDMVVGEDDIAALVAAWTGVPVTRLLETEVDRLLHMEDRLHARVIGQEHPITVVSEAVRRARAGLKDPKRPIGGFMFLGPTGVGKTELARALAEFLFDDEEAMIRVDMSEYMEQHTISRLIGSPPGYVGYDEGGQLTEQVRRRPFRVVLFDEVEKAHPRVFDLLLQVLEDGRLTDGHGRTVDFRNTVVIMTSNLGTAEFARPHTLGFRRGAEGDTERERLRTAIDGEVKKTFRPEFLNRLDEVVIFDPLSQDEIRQIVNLMVKGVQERLSEREIRIELTEAARDWLAHQGFDHVFGARPLRRTIQRYVENPLSNRILTGEARDGDTVIVDAVEGVKALTFRLAEEAVAVAA